LDGYLTVVQRWIVVALSALLIVVVVLATVHMAVLIGESIWNSPHFLIPIHGLLEIFGFFLLVLIGVELLETLRAYLRKDVIHLHVVLEVALIAVARKVIVAEPDVVPSSSLFAIAALILALAAASYLERHPRRAKARPSHHRVPGATGD
jgi:uncharacterized membrane protein (DUF373 family)